MSTVASSQFCNDYADKAVKQYKLAKSNNLPNINWPLWTDDWDGHNNWCKTVTEDVANKETAKRQAVLDKYIKPKTKEDYCNTYADTAIKQYTRAVQINLPDMNTLMWNNNRDIHFKWCMAVTEDIAENEESKRQKQIDDFLNQDQKKNKQDSNAVSDYKIIEVTPLPDLTHLIGLKERVSDHYAKESVRQNEENISKGCGFNDATWSSDYNAHKKWCMHGDNYLEADKVLADREKQLKGCKEHQTIWIPEMVIGLGLRDYKGRNLDLTVPVMEYLLKKGKNPVLRHTRDETSDCSYVWHGLSRGWDWISIEKGSFKNADQYHLPPGVVIDLQHTMDNIPVGIFGIVSTIKYAPESIGKGNFHKECGGDLGAPAGEGLCWYESTGLNFTDWAQVEKLPKGTVIGLKHNGNQPNKKMIWQDHVYDPANPYIQPPSGFVRIVGGDWCAPAGVGYYWYEKITGK